MFKTVFWEVQSTESFILTVTNIFIKKHSFSYPVYLSCFSSLTQFLEMIFSYLKFHICNRNEWKPENPYEYRCKTVCIDHVPQLVNVYKIMFVPTKMYNFPWIHAIFQVNIDIFVIILFSDAF